ncbi:interferon-induced very large GTPase 1-like [Clarias magur]|uniref:Interferon-induced very large GTPase 1-like n=1 Tax=Clarias magur TaxID=1594786 RepID=A0A8J4TD37_CLAMG|nr:interferon-induced very large GTPase 1-like [Clarias magur]
MHVIKETEGLIHEICNKIIRLGYKDSYIQEITDTVRTRVEEYQTICTNTIGGHDGDHSVPFHRVNGTGGMCYRARNPSEPVPYKSYRSAGGHYATWSITPDNSQLPYWKWFMCRFKQDLENHYKKTFEGEGEIPREWRDFTKEQAIESLDNYI